ncbi:hypothetical protein AO501_33915 [Mycobacterium gordonae]|uniref:Uncharacterized protein n=1 Tax=Mycobacterium gordonae TaxID=1778 RepID=A0A0Q2R7J7_MYCGO|nr:hypothetical protein AO501_33915 [Mycobacterium gordonae]
MKLTGWPVAGDEGRAPETHRFDCVAWDDDGVRSAVAQTAFDVFTQFGILVGKRSSLDRETDRVAVGCTGMLWTHHEGIDAAYTCEINGPVGVRAVDYFSEVTYARGDVGHSVQ